MSSRNRILDAAESLMAQGGYAATGISAISRASGLPASSIYWHFESKAGLLAAVLQRGQQRLFEILAPVPGRAPSLPALIDRGYGVLGSERTEFIRLLVQVGLERRDSDPETAAAISGVRERSVAFMRDAIVPLCKERGVDRPDDVADECAHFAMTFTQGCFVLHAIDPGSIDLEVAARQILISLEALICARLGDSST